MTWTWWAIVLLSYLHPHWYYPSVKRHLSIAECKRKMGAENLADPEMKGLPRREVEHAFDSFCEWYGGMDIFDKCRAGFHMDSRFDGVLSSYPVCHRDDDNDLGHGPQGLLCDRYRAPGGWPRGEQTVWP